MKLTRCRMCGSANLYQYLDLGFTPLADRLLTKLELDDEEVYYPLRVSFCETCGLHQLDYVVDPKILFQKDYPYDMSTTMTGGEHWNTFAGNTVKRFELKQNDLVIDVGSNSGVLLQKFRNRGMRVLGIDPAPNIAKIAVERGVDTLCDFFSRSVAKRAVTDFGKAAVITGTNVFAHIHNLDDVMEGVGELLDEKGVFIVESPYLVNLLEGLEYDTIYHEHLSYLSIKPIDRFVKKFGMEVIDVIQTPIHGGSMRVMIARSGARKKTESAEQLAREEGCKKIYERTYLDRFAKRVAAHREIFFDLLYALKKAGKKIVGVSVPAKGMTLLNYCGVGTQILDCVSEKSELKIGRYTPGGHIPIISDDELIRRRPDYALLLAWNFAPEIIENLSALTEHGGKFIIPIPKPKIV